jgi:hypothetical protein
MRWPERRATTEEIVLRPYGRLTGRWSGSPGVPNAADVDEAIRGRVLHATARNLRRARRAPRKLLTIDRLVTEALVDTVLKSEVHL